nr:prepilin-type N-terminal cleavage/methylation domain-containing protein [Hafnia paralvei]
MNNAPTTILNFNQQSGFTLIELMVIIYANLKLK